MPRIHPLAFALSLTTTGTLAALYTDYSQLPAGKVYDYIVVGGQSHPNQIEVKLDSRHLAAGLAGSTVATRLSENPNRNVLVLEAGVKLVLQQSCIRVLIALNSADAIIEHQVPLLAPFVLGGPSKH
jgi:hypothetical protein